MTRSTPLFACALVLFGTGCGSDRPRPAPGIVDCSVTEGYEFRSIFNFQGNVENLDTGWFRYVDPTPSGYPDPEKVNVENPDVNDPEQGSNVRIFDYTQKRCNEAETLAMKFEASGHNFWGAGFGSYRHNDPGTQDAEGANYEGISFWARSPRNAEKSFLLNVDDRRTILNAPDACRGRALDDQPPECQVETEEDPALGDEEPPPASGAGEYSCMTEYGLLAPATEADQDLDGDGCVGPGDIVSGTECRLPPPQDLGDPACYNGGVNQPSAAGTRVPAADECGNQFHTLLTTSETWQLFLIPWNELVQWPCPNRLVGGINSAAITKFEIKFDQGTRYELWIDNIAFYRKL